MLTLICVDLWSYGRMFYGVMRANFLDKWISGMLGSKKAKLMSRRTLSPWSNMEVDQPCYGGVCCCRKWKSWLLWKTSWILWCIRPKIVMPAVNRQKLMVIGPQMILRWALFVTYTIIQSIMRSEMCFLDVFPIQVEQWAADTAAPGEQLGVRCLAQGSPWTLPARAGIRSHNLGLPRVSSPTLYPLGHDCPNKAFLKDSHPKVCIQIHWS